MSNHTPGPWFLDGHVRLTDPVVSNTDYQIAICLTHPIPESAAANARLIAAAPDLLSVLSEVAECAEYWSEYDVPVGIADRIKQAITKATGEQP